MSKPTRERRLTPSGAAAWYVLTIDPEFLASLPAPVQDGTLAYPLAQRAIGFQARMRKRLLIVWCVALVAVAVAVAVEGSSLALGCLLVGAVVVGMTVMTLVYQVSVRGMVYEADRMIAAMLGTDAMMAFIDYRRANPPDYSELSWKWRFLNRLRPAPDERAKRLLLSGSRVAPGGFTPSPPRQELTRRVGDNPERMSDLSRGGESDKLAADRSVSPRLLPATETTSLCVSA